MNASRTQLSIITPAFNATAFLPALIASVEAAYVEVASAQVKLEWILVDDGSTDDTAEIFRASAQRHAAWRMVQQPNGGVASARNRGLAEARGEYVWFVDADDVIVPAAMTALAQAAATGVDLLSFQAERFSVIDGVETSENVYREKKSSQPQRGSEWVSQLISQKDWKHYLWQYWVRRELLVQHSIQFRVGIIHEDIAFVTQAALLASSVLYVDTLAYQYRENSSSLSHHADDTKLLVRIESYFAVLEQLRTLNTKIAMPAPTRAQLEGEVIGQALQIFELAEQLTNPANRHAVLVKSQQHRLAQQLFREAHNIKRLRQVMVMWLKQSGLLPIGAPGTK